MTKLRLKRGRKNGNAIPRRRAWDGIDIRPQVFVRWALSRHLEAVSWKQGVRTTSW